MDEAVKIKLYKDAWKLFGSASQLDILIEEMAELTQAILHCRRHDIVLSFNLMEELGHVQICIEQLETFLDSIPHGGERYTTYLEKSNALKEKRIEDFAKIVEDEKKARGVE